MKLSRLAATFASVALLYASAAIAGESNKATIRFDQKVTVDGKMIDSGKYTAEWTGEGSNVQVTLHHGKETVATFAARINQEPTANPDDAIGTTDGPNGSKQLTAIYPSGKRLSIQLGNGSGGASNASSSPSR
ncbi:MAG TPA: hypothetical protein VGJ06_20140 [Candidatus Acidoferrum sp.]|jgi:hypothetical protein